MRRWDGGRWLQRNLLLTGCFVADDHKLPMALDLDNDDEVIYQIVGEDEADLKEGRISITSPLARGLVGRQVDDAVEVTTPRGSREYEVLAIDYK